MISTTYSDIFLILNITADEQLKIKLLLNSDINPKRVCLFVIRGLKYLCTTCGVIWDGYMGSGHPLGFGARQLCITCFQDPGITNVMSRSQAKAMYAMKESELPSVVRFSLNFYM